MLLIQTASVKILGREIDIVQEGGSFIDALHRRPSSEPHSQRTPEQSHFQGTLELEAAAIELLKLVDRSAENDFTIAVLTPSDAGQTVLHLTASLGFARLLQELIVRGVSFDHRDFNGYTALHFSALYGHIECARLLVDGGADPDIINTNGHTALEIAQESGHSAIAEFLKMSTQADADKGIKQKDHKDDASQGALVPEPNNPASDFPPAKRKTGERSPARHAPAMAKDRHEGAKRSGDPTFKSSLARLRMGTWWPTTATHIPRIPAQVIQNNATLAWWLVPSASSTRLLQNAIKEAAPKHYGSTFHLHVTLFSLENADKTIEDLLKATQPVIAETKTPISLKQAGPQAGGNFNRTIYLALYPTAELKTLRANLLEAIGAPSNPYSPIYYGGRSDGGWRPVVRLMDAHVVFDEKFLGLGKVLDFTEVWIVDVTTEQPASWKVLHKQALAGTEIAPPFPKSPPLGRKIAKTHSRTQGHLLPVFPSDISWSIPAVSTRPRMPHALVPTSQSSRDSAAYQYFDSAPSYSTSSQASYVPYYSNSSPASYVPYYSNNPPASYVPSYSTSPQTSSVPFYRTIYPQASPPVPPDSTSPMPPHRASSALSYSTSSAPPYSTTPMPPYVAYSARPPHRPHFGAGAEPPTPWRPLPPVPLSSPFERPPGPFAP